jgi:hypothetical protein
MATRTRQRHPHNAPFILAAGLLLVSAAAVPQTAPPPADPNAPPPGDPNAPPAAYPPPANTGYPPPGNTGYPPPNAGYPPPGNTGYPPPGQYPPGYSPPPGYAPPGYMNPPPPPPQHEGFYLRLHLGGGFGRMGGTDSYGDELAFSGGGYSFGIALGGAVMPNLIVFGNLFGMGLIDPDTEFNGGSTGTVSGTTSMAGIGPGIAYYFQPVNVFVSGTIAATVFTAADSDGNTQYESNTGVGFQGMVGKEWWVSHEWGLGIAGELIATGGMKDKVDPTIKWSGTSFSLLFTSTYN